MILRAILNVGCFFVVKYSSENEFFIVFAQKVSYGRKNWIDFEV